jgi:tripartite-type tricarboxylate transporter receptor subunit TctC
MKLPRRKFLYLAAAGLPAASRMARAQTYPTRPVTLIVPFPPGGSTDPVGRILAARMSEKLGQPVIVENVGGAGGSIGVGRLARAAADGYTIDIGQWDTHVLNGVVYNLNYDLQKDFTPIGLASINPVLLVARKAFPADDLKSLVAWMKAHPGEARFGNGSAATRLGGYLLEKLGNAKMLFVPYRGAGPAMTDLMAGQIDLLVVQAAGGMPQVRAGTIKALANLSAHRSEAIPAIPSADESGLSGLYLSSWFGLFAPKGAPSDAVAKINIAMVQTLAEPGVRQKIIGLGLDVAASEQQTPAGFAAFYQAELAKWWPIVRASGIKAQ